MTMKHTRLLVLLPLSVSALACSTPTDPAEVESASSNISVAEDCRALDTLEGQQCYGIATTESQLLGPSSFGGVGSDREIVVLDSRTCGNQGKACLASRTTVAEAQLVRSSTLSGTALDPTALVGGQCWSNPTTSRTKRSCREPVFGGECRGAFSLSGYKDADGNDHAYLGSGKRCGQGRSCVVVNDPRARDSDPSGFGRPLAVSVTGVCEDIAGVDFTTSGLPLVFGPAHPCSAPAAACKTGWDRFR